MKKILTLIIICFSLSSCAVFYGDNYNNSNKVKNLQLGMSKEDALAIMGNHYVIEQVSEEEDGTLEIVKYYSAQDVPYLLHFINNELVLFNRYYPPQVPEQKVTITNNSN